MGRGLRLFFPRSLISVLVRWTPERWINNVHSTSNERNEFRMWAGSSGYLVHMNYPFVSIFGYPTILYKYNTYTDDGRMLTSVPIS